MSFRKTKKTKQLENFVSGLERHIKNHLHLPRNTHGKRKSSIQGQLFSVFVEYLEIYYQAKGFVNYREKAASSFYWEGQHNKDNRRSPQEFFASRNYPDFIIQRPYSIAICADDNLGNSHRVDVGTTGEDIR